MNILILGASGLVGGACYNLFIQNTRFKVIGTHFTFPTDYTFFVDTTSEELLHNQTIEEFRPEVIIHAGALTHVDLCEKEPTKSYQMTVASTRNALKLAEKHQAKLVFISTDYIFDGKKGPYLEDDTPNPLSVYGRDKLLAEQTIKSYLNHLIIRITNVYGDEIRGKNFISRLIEMAKSGEKHSLNLPNDQYATPVNAKDVSKALQLLLTNDCQGVYHLASTDNLNRVQLARRVLLYYPQNTVEVTHSITKLLNQSAERPLKGGLLSHKFLSQFPDFEYTNIDDYLKEQAFRKND